jgi:hypothetical protein
VAAEDHVVRRLGERRVEHVGLGEAQASEALPLLLGTSDHPCREVQSVDLEAGLGKEHR